MWTRPLKTLQGKEMEKVLEDLFKNLQPEVFRTDEVSKFNNKWVKSLLRNRNIKHVVTLNETKANYVERAIKSIKMKLSKYMYNKQ